MSDLELRLHALHVHPVKSCAGFETAAARLVATGLEGDRQWMVVDEAGVFVTQRELPRLQLVRPTPQPGALALDAPGRPTLLVHEDRLEAARRVRVWDDEVLGRDAGDAAARWLQEATGQALRLVRFDARQRRPSSRRWCGDIDAETAFADAFPLLVISTASLAELNRRLAARGQPPATMARFRPNLVLDGLDAHGEDFLDHFTLDTDDGPVVLRPVKPCARCTIPNVDPASAERGHEPGDTLAGYRADTRLDGAVTFGMNAVIVEGIGRTLRVGARGAATIAF